MINLDKRECRHYACTRTANWLVGDGVVRTLLCNGHKNPPMVRHAFVIAAAAYVWPDPAQRAA
ncbi:hypothetical protein DY218_27430 [Streptomyces triticagri]|uniref:Uncharacterized protein n=1 Tax=Streptomyces triticagri TaxID=2293568 RepID=A0A372LYB1_9ACTN|nr:hypothetical protein [Streptomyces triticagri]RFU83642.1 hypothetical protein DY218_27430 [Streptomyces triticagri]